MIGVPVEGSDYPLQKAINSGPCGDTFKDLRINIDGWVNVSANWSNAEHSNMPTAYWFDPNSLQLDQFVLRAQRSCDTVQTDHVDWGFRSVLLYGQDYRYMVAGGWQPASDELLLHNDQYGLDLTEQYVEVYIPGITQGMEVRVGRWIACPDIETQYAPDNYMATHSLLFTYDTYTQTGAMFSFMLNDRWMVQGAITAGTDMAPWYEGATPTGMFGVRWVSESNKDSFYTCLNNINGAEFRHFDLEEGPAGHDNFNYIVTTWQHTFTPEIHMKTEGYYMWQVDAELGGTPSLGPVIRSAAAAATAPCYRACPRPTAWSTTLNCHLEKGLHFGPQRVVGRSPRHAVGLPGRLQQPCHRVDPQLQQSPANPARSGLLPQLGPAGVRPWNQAKPGADRIRRNLSLLTGEGPGARVENGECTHPEPLFP